MNFRLDRIATLYIVNPLKRRARDSPSSIPILMYHSVSDEDESGLHPYYRTATSPRMFSAQMRRLHEAGYSAISLGEAVTRIKESSQKLPLSVVITFDDGFRDFYNNAALVLNEYGFTATMFLPTAYIGTSNLTFKRKECLTWSEVRELSKHGISFGSHTVSHPKLYGLSSEEIKKEVVVSKHTIEHETGSAVESFAYPYAFPENDDKFKKGLRDTLSEAGYNNGVCTTVGRPVEKSDPLFLQRLPVNSDDDLQFFQSKLDGGYDWMARPQYAVKVAKSWIASQRRREKC